MVNYDTVLIRFGELSTKGKNRKDFINRLYGNIKYMLRDFEALEYRKAYDRIYIKLNGTDHDAVGEKLKKVFGISSFSFTEKVPSDIDSISAACLRIAKESGYKTFKMITKRHDKSFPMRSDEINRACAGNILRNTDLKVDVHNPELAIRVEVQEKDTYITSEKIPGAGGYPAGINGKVLLLLSGGIDSPVAAYMIAKRGVKIEAVYFHAPPYTSERAKEKVVDLAKKISVYTGKMKLHVINFTDIQMAIYQKCPPDELTIIMRRYMMRIAEHIAKENKCIGLITGESIGQVASQTMQSLLCTNAVCELPVYRPLIAFDKQDIVDIAEKIDTYETSVLPYEDCCTIFVAKHPVTKPILGVIEMHEHNLDDCIEEMLNKAINEREVIDI